MSKKRKRNLSESSHSSRSSGSSESEEEVVRKYKKVAPKWPAKKSNLPAVVVFGEYKDTEDNIMVAERFGITKINLRKLLN